MQTIWQTARFALDLSTPKIMGIINLTPDSFSDGGTYSRSFQAAFSPEPTKASISTMGNTGPAKNTSSQSIKLSARLRSSPK